MAIECVLCGFSSENEIITHLREAHEGGLKQYLAVFPDLPVVSAALYTAIENCVFFGYIDDTPGLDIIKASEMEMLMVHAKNNASMRSEITVEPDF